MTHKFILTVLMIVSSLVLTTQVNALNPLTQACQGKAASSPACVQAKAQDTNNTNPIAGPNGIISKAANIIALIAGLGAVIMIILGGFAYVTSAGNAESVTKARQRILAATIGLLVVALSWSIVRFVTDRVIQ
jgi:hypothetical protein